MTTFDNDSLAKISNIFECKICNYSTSRKYNLDLHNNSIKHKNRILTTFDNENIVKVSKKYQCENCIKQFNDRAGLWRHKKKCNIAETKNINNDIDEMMNDKELFKYLLKENSEFKHFMLEQNKQMIELAKKAGNNNNNTTNNNQQFNLNFYLNETCKNAMNIMDFVSQLQVGIKDLEETGRLGYAEGISKIFINGLKQMNVSDRPIHCSDLKRETLYIKNNNEWNKETENKVILTNAIKHVAHKNIKQISEWTKIHPDYRDSKSKENDRYLKIVSESMSGTNEEETNKNYSKIIKNIVKETVIDKTVDTV